MDSDLAPLSKALESRLAAPEIGPIVEDHKSLLHGKANGIRYRMSAYR
jgi:hypothetical protein